MDDTTILGGTLNQLGQTAKQAVKQVVKIPEEIAADAGGQVGSAPTKQDSAQETDLKENQKWQSDEERIKFLKGLYGSTEQTSSVRQDSLGKKPEEKQTTSANPLVSSAQEKPSEFQEQIKDKSPEEQKKLIELRNQLHRENYYDPTFNPVKNPPAGGEERPAEKVENEKKQEMIDLQKKEEKKPPPLAVVREQNKAEQFRGAAG